MLVEFDCGCIATLNDEPEALILEGCAKHSQFYGNRAFLAPFMHSHKYVPLTSPKLASFKRRIVRRLQDGEKMEQIKVLLRG